MEPTTPAPGTTPAEGVQRLQGLVGHWQASGRVVTDGTPITGTDTYEWLPGRGHLGHHVDVEIGGKPLRAFEVLSANPDSDDFVARAFDDTGGVETMTVEVTGDRWLFGGGVDTASAAGGEAERTGEVRSLLQVDADGRGMSALWQRASPDGWVDWMDMRFVPSQEPRPPVCPSLPAASMQALARLVGAWSWEGRSHDASFAVTGQTTFEWLPGGHFLVERGALTSEGVTSHSVAVVGRHEGRYLARYFDGNGTYDEYTLRLRRDGRLDIDWEQVRFRGRLEPPGDEIRGAWEVRADDTWRYWYDAELRRRPVHRPR